MYTNEGWIKIHRKMLDWDWYKDTNTKVLFLHLLLKSNHQTKRFKGKEIPAGSLLTGRDVLAEQTGLSVMQVRVALEHLKVTNEITIKTSSRGSHIFITNWADYQNTQQEVTSKITNKQPASNQQVTTNKNEENVKNEKNKNGTHQIGAILENSKLKKRIEAGSKQKGAYSKLQARAIELAKYFEESDAVGRWIGIVKNHSDSDLDKAYSFVVDYPDTSKKGKAKLFLWKLAQLKK